MDPTDVVGVPHPDHENGCTRFLAPYDFIQLTEDADGDKGPVIALFDDLPASIEQVFNALLGVIGGRVVGGRPIRDNVLLCATGNRAEDKAGAQEIGTALSNRFIHFEIRLDHEDWVEWAFEHRVSQRSLEAISSILKGCVGKKPYENMWSSPAIGKSDILNQLAAEEGWPLYEISWGPRGYTALKSRIKGAWHDLRCGLAKWIAPDV